MDAILDTHADFLTTMMNLFNTSYNNQAEYSALLTGTLKATERLSVTMSPVDLDTLLDGVLGSYDLLDCKESREFLIGTLGHLKMILSVTERELDRSELPKAWDSYNKLFFKVYN